MFWGPPGSGKTTFAMTLAKVFNYEPFVINVSDEWNGPDLFNKLKNVYSTQRLFEWCKQCRSNFDFQKNLDHVCSKPKTLIILDEVDGVVNSIKNSAI